MREETREGCRRFAIMMGGASMRGFELSLGDECMCHPLVFSSFYGASMYQSHRVELALQWP